MLEDGDARMVASGQERAHCGVGGIWVQSNPSGSEHHILMPLLSFGKRDAAQDLVGSSSKTAFSQTFSKQELYSEQHCLRKKTSPLLFFCRHHFAIYFLLSFIYLFFKLMLAVIIHTIIP